MRHAFDWSTQRRAYSPALAYTGSIHVNVTLPDVGRVPKDKPASEGGPAEPPKGKRASSPFVRAHERAAMALQWLQPLLVAVLGAPHPLGALDPAAFPAVSFRHMSENLSGMVANNVAASGLNPGRTVESGRVLRDPWENRARRVDTFLTEERSDVRALLKDMSDAARGLPLRGAPAWVSALASARGKDEAAAAFVSGKYAGCPCLPRIGTDYRRDRYKGQGFGFEFRSLDRVPADALPDVLRVLFYVFDTSHAKEKGAVTRLRRAENNAVESVAFVGFLKAAARLGSAAPVTKPYADALWRVLGVRVSPAATAHEALNAAAASLFERFGGGRGRYSRHVDLDAGGAHYAEAPVLPDLNAAAREYHSAMLGLVPKRARAPKKREEDGAAT
jgi:hypothetical protein